MNDAKDPLQGIVRQLLEQLGEDPDRDGLQRTPTRVAKAFRFLTEGYAQDPLAILNDALFEVTYDEMVLVKDIDFYSLCEHHVIPFFGRVHVAYIPNGRVVGLSKIPRLVEMFARRLQVQERLTVEIGETIEKVLRPRGVAVVVEAHMMEPEMAGAGMVVIPAMDGSGALIIEIAGMVPSVVQTIIKKEAIVIIEASLVLKSIMLQVRKLFLVDGVLVEVAVVVVVEVGVIVQLEAKVAVMTEVGLDLVVVKLEA